MPDSSDRPGDAERWRLAQFMFEIAPLASVAEAVAAATEYEKRVYVERMARGWRWSLAIPGGGYPLLRIAARFLKGDHYRLIVPFRTVEGHAIVCRDPAHPSKPRAWRFVDFEGPTPRQEVERRIRVAFAEVA